MYFRHFQQGQARVGSQYLLVTVIIMVVVVVVVIIIIMFVISAQIIVLGLP